MEEEFFCNAEEIVRLKNLSLTIPGLEMNHPVWYDFDFSIVFIYHKNDLEYIFYVTPVFSQGNIINYKLYDKVSLLIKDLIASDDRDNFPSSDYNKLDGGLFFPKEVSYDEVVKAMLNIDMADAYDPNKKFWV